MMRFTFSFLTAIFAGLVTAGMAPPARADFVVILSDGKGNSVYADATTSTIVTAGSASTSSTPSSAFAPGQIALSAKVGNFNVTFTTLFGTPLENGPSQQGLDMTNVSVSSSGGGTLTVTGYQTGDNLGSGIKGTLASIFGGTTLGASSSVTGQAWFDGSNTGNSSSLPGFTTPGGSVAAFSPVFAGSGAFSGSGGAIVSLNGDFALINQVGITFGSSGGTGSFDMDTTLTTPEPSSMTLLGLGAAAMIGYAWRRRMAGALSAIA
jgi:hypothetical protein